jgi:hypothetical protein
MAATLATLPITVITFNQISLIAPLVNMAILWMVPPLMVIGGVGALIGLVWLPLGQVILWLGWPLLWAFIAVEEIGAAVPWALVDIEQTNWWLGAGWWLIIAAWWVIPGRRGKKGEKGNEEKEGL